MDLRSEQQQVRRSTGKNRFADRNVPKSKSMQTLETNLDDDDDEDDLLGESSFRRVPSIHELRVSRSLQKLNVPAWYKNSSVSRSGSCILNRDSDSMKSFDWRFNASLTSSPASSIISHQAPVVIKTRVTPSYTRSYSAPIKTPKLVLPPKPANVRLPSDQFRNQEKPKGLMPIPIVPFLKIREMFEKKSQENHAQPSPVNSVTKTPVKTLKPELPKRITPIKREPDSLSQSKKSPVSPGFSPALRIDEAIEETNEEEEFLEDSTDAVGNSYTSTQPYVTPTKYEVAGVNVPETVTFSTAAPLINGNSTHVQDGRHVYFNNSTTVESSAEVLNDKVSEQYHTVDQAAPIIRRPVARRPAEVDTKQLVEPSAQATTSESKEPTDAAEEETRTTQEDSESKEKSRKVVKVSERIQMYDQASSSKEPEKTKASKDWKPKLFSFRDNKVAKSQPKQTPPQPPPPKAKLPVPFFRNRKGKGDINVSTSLSPNPLTTSSATPNNNSHVNSLSMTHVSLNPNTTDKTNRNSKSSISNTHYSTNSSNVLNMYDKTNSSAINTYDKSNTSALNTHCNNGCSHTTNNSPLIINKNICSSENDPFFEFLQRPQYDPLTSVHQGRPTSIEQIQSSLGRPYTDLSFRMPSQPQQPMLDTLKHSPLCRPVSSGDEHCTIFGLSIGKRDQPATPLVNTDLGSSYAESVSLNRTCNTEVANTDASLDEVLESLLALKN